MYRLLTKNGYEFWCDYDKSSELHIIYLDRQRESCIGEFDTLSEAKEYISDWLQQQ